MHAHMCDVAEFKVDVNSSNDRVLHITKQLLTALREGDIVYCESVVVRSMIRASGKRKRSSSQPWAEYEARLQLHRLLVLYRS